MEKTEKRLSQKAVEKRAHQQDHQRDSKILVFNNQLSSIHMISFILKERKKRKSISELLNS